MLASMLAMCCFYICDMILFVKIIVCEVLNKHELKLMSYLLLYLPFFTRSFHIFFHFFHSSHFSTTRFQHNAKSYEMKLCTQLHETRRSKNSRIQSFFGFSTKKSRVRVFLLNKPIK